MKQYETPIVLLIPTGAGVADFLYTSGDAVVRDPFVDDSYGLIFGGKENGQ